MNLKEGELVMWFSEFRDSMCIAFLVMFGSYRKGQGWNTFRHERYFNQILLLKKYSSEYIHHVE